MFNLFKKKSTGIDAILEMQDITEKVIVLHQFCNLHANDFTDTERIINAVLDMESEVMNGGFQQYFQNSAGDQWQDALAGLDKLGAVKTKALLIKALTVFENSKPSLVWEERQEVANNLSEEHISLLETLDQEFYDYEDNLQSLVIAYAETHRDDFGE